MKRKRKEVQNKKFATAGHILNDDFFRCDYFDAKRGDFQRSKTNFIKVLWIF